jgi:YD repeat-containing protein
MRAQKPKNKVVQKGDCEAIQHHMLELLDWVGTLETLTDQTLPMLSHLLGLPQSHQWTNHRISKNSRYTYFGRDNVTEETLQWVETEMSLMDRELYNMAQQEQHQCPESFTLCQ